MDHSQKIQENRFLFFFYKTSSWQHYRSRTKKQLQFVEEFCEIKVVIVVFCVFEVNKMQMYAITDLYQYNQYWYDLETYPITSWSFAIKNVLAIESFLWNSSGSTNLDEGDEDDADDDNDDGGDNKLTKPTQGLYWLVVWSIHHTSRWTCHFWLRNCIVFGL